MSFLTMRDFFLGVKEGQKKFGEVIGGVVNSILLTVVYFLGVGVVYFPSKLTGKKFLDKEINSGSSYWESLELSTKKKEDYYRQF